MRGMSKREACEGARGGFPRDRGTKVCIAMNIYMDLKKP